MAQHLVADVEPVGEVLPYDDAPVSELSPLSRNKRCSCEAPKPLVANGQRYTVILTITADREPLADRKIRLSMPQRWRKNGREVNYLRISSSLIGYKRDWTMEDDGKVVFDGFAAPVTLSKKLGVIQAKADLLYFPLQGDLVVTDLPTSESCKATYTLIARHTDDGWKAAKVMRAADYRITRKNRGRFRRLHQAHPTQARTVLGPWWSNQRSLDPSTVARSS